MRCLTEGMSKQPFTVTLTIKVNADEYIRAFAVEAPTEGDAIKVAEQRMPHLPTTDAVHQGSDGGWLRAVGSSVVSGHTPGAWHWEGGWNGQLVRR